MKVETGIGGCTYSEMTTILERKRRYWLRTNLVWLNISNV